MKIVDVETFLVGNVPPYRGGRCWLFVKLVTDEEIEGLGEWSMDLLKEPIRFENGYITPPTKPGLGAELREDIVAKHLYRPSQSSP